MTTWSLAPRVPARSAAWRTACVAVSDPSVPTTMPANTPGIIGAVIALHCHVLPAIDDGPATVQDAIALARGAREDGTTTIAATPHVVWELPHVTAARVA